MIIYGSCFEDSGATILARVADQDGTTALQADITSITLKVYDIDNADTEAQSATLTVSAVIFDTLQTDSRWTVDSTGYNFLYTVPASTLATPSHRYRAEFKFTPAIGEVYWVVSVIAVVPVITS